MHLQPQLSADHGSSSSLWKFKKIEEIATDIKSVGSFTFIRSTKNLTMCFSKPEPMKQSVAAQRPVQQYTGMKNALAITIPAGWLTTITSVRKLYEGRISLSRAFNRSLVEITLILSESVVMSMGQRRSKILSVDGMLSTRR